MPIDQPFCRVHRMNERRFLLLVWIQLILFTEQSLLTWSETDASWNGTSFPIQERSLNSFFDPSIALTGCLADRRDLLDWVVCDNIGISMTFYSIWTRALTFNHSRIQTSCIYLAVMSYLELPTDGKNLCWFVEGRDDSLAPIRISIRGFSDS